MSEKARQGGRTRLYAPERVPRLSCDAFEIRQQPLACYGEESDLKVIHLACNLAIQLGKEVEEREGSRTEREEGNKYTLSSKYHHFQRIKGYFEPGIGAGKGRGEVEEHATAHVKLLMTTETAQAKRVRLRFKLPTNTTGESLCKLTTDI